jgi:hypothetical protein
VTRSGVSPSMVRPFPTRVPRLILILAPMSAVLAGCGRPEQAGNGAQADVRTTAPQPAPASSSARAKPALTAQGYDTIRIGAKPADAIGYALAPVGGTPEDACRIFRSPRVPGLAVMVEQGVVTRLTAHGDAKVRTERGIGVGSTEAEVRAAYRPLGESPHKYDAAPAKNLVWGEEGVPEALRFEIGADGRVVQLHAGASPALMYVEGCG